MNDAAGDPRREGEGPSATGAVAPSPVTLRRLGSAFLAIGLASFSLAALGEAKTWLSERRRWFTSEEYVQGLGLAQLLPGAPSVNMMSYFGFRLRGLPGAATAAVSFLLPGASSMLLLSYLYLRYGELPAMAGLVRGLGAMVLGLVLNTVLNLWKAGVKTRLQWLMALGGFALVFWLRMGIVSLLVFAGAASLAAVLAGRRFTAARRWIEPAGAPPRTRGAGSATGQDVTFVSACGLVPLHLGWRRTATLASWLGAILCVDLLLIRSTPDLLRMGSELLRIGALTFGSGYAMLPFIQDVAVRQFAWVSEKQFAVALALSLVTPGPVILVAGFIGYKVAGVPGGVAGIVNVCLPAWALTNLLASAWARVGQVPYVREVIGGVVAAFVGTLAVVVWKLGATTLVDVPAVAMAAGAFASQRLAKLDTVWIVLGGAALSVLALR